jgi:hypothetical protein
MNKFLFKILIVSFFVFPSPSSGTGLVMQDFSYPICANGNGETVLNFYESFNGDVNNCEYKVVLASLFTSW